MYKRQGLTADDECKVDIGGEIPEGAMASCGDFGTCECLDCESNLPFKRRVEINRPGPNSISGLGYSIDVESGDCAEKEFVTGPDDFTAPMTGLRGRYTDSSGPKTSRRMNSMWRKVTLAGQSGACRSRLSVDPH